MIKINFKGIESIPKMYNMKKAQMSFATQVEIKSQLFVPFDEGYLMESAQIEQDGRVLSYGKIGPANAYARKMYYGDHFNFQQKGSGVRGSRWVQRMWDADGRSIIRKMQVDFNKGEFDR